MWISQFYVVQFSVNYKYVRSNLGCAVADHAVLLAAGDFDTVSHAIVDSAASLHLYTHTIRS